MGIILCTECNKKVSDLASTCPKCGAPLTEEMKTKGAINRFLRPLIWLLGIGLIIGSCYGYLKTCHF